MNPLTILAREKLKTKKVSAVMSAKGGVGKSLISALLAMLYSKREKTVLIDLDIHGMSAAKLFGVENKLHSVTRYGILPFYIQDLGIITLNGIVKDRYIVLPGSDRGSVMESLISYSDFRSAEHVVFDMPPGLSDEILILNRITKYDPIIVTTPSKISTKTVEQLLQFLNDTKIAPKYLIVNMAYINYENTIIRPFGDIIHAKKLSEKYNANLIEIPIDPSIEEFVGRIHEYNGEIIKKLSAVI
ncbi:MAG: P-loop NTPase [Thermoprotei archaeon]